jgi:adenylate cyclase
MNSYEFADKVVMFCDIHDFSKITIRIGRTYPDFVQRYYSEIGEIIVRSGGKIIKYLGDAILAIFEMGAETEAVNCAKTMREKYAFLMKELNLETESDLEVGMSSGKICQGRFGHESLMLWDIFGRIVNEAAAIGHYRGIALTEAVQGRIADEIETKRLPDMQVKWQDEPLKIWAVC